MKELGAVYRLLGDDARLRILRLLSLERLNVTELTGVLGLAQSGVSRHLGLLKDAGWVLEERDSGYSFYRVDPSARDGALGPLWAALEAQFAAGSRTASLAADDARLQEVLRLRRENFETHGSETRQLVPGRSWAAWARALGHLLPPLRVADLGCGEGYLTLEIARWARRVIAVDRSDEVLARARAMAARRRVRNVVWKRGEIERLPLDDATLDVALLSHALHHAVEPSRALAEARRILVPGGRLLVLELRRHEQAWVRERLGDRWLGFSDAALTRLLRQAGLTGVKLQVGVRWPGDPFTVLVASGHRPDVERSAGRRPARARRAPARRPRRDRPTPIHESRRT